MAPVDNSSGGSGLGAGLDLATLYGKKKAAEALGLELPDFGLGGGTAATSVMPEATSVGVGLPTESGLTLGTGAAAPSATSLAGIGTAGNVVLPIAGGLGALDLLMNKKHGGAGAAQGALSGAAIGSYGGPVGAGIGALVGGGIGYFGNFGDRDRWKTEGDREAKLVASGALPASVLKDNPTKGRSPQELLAIEQAKTKAGQYSNEKFSQSRDVKDLKPEDIWGYSAFAEKYGKDWLGKFTEQQRRDIAQQALNSGAVSEGKGTINIDWGKFGAGKPVTGTASNEPGKMPATTTANSKASAGVDVGASLSKIYEQQAQQAAAQDKKNKLLSMVGNNAPVQAQQFDYSGMLKNKYA